MSLTSSPRPWVKPGSGSKLLLFSVLLFLLLFSDHKIRSLYALPFPHFDRLTSGSYMFQDVSAIAGGFRSVAADIAWVQLLQNVSGSGPLGENMVRDMPTLKDDVLRIVRIDPYFRRAYMFGAGILAWFPSVNRPEEALEILAEGIQNNPSYWILRSYAGAIVYRKKADFVKVADLLEQAAQQPDCPGLVKAILANTYKAIGRYQDAVRVWEQVLDDPDNADYHARAEEQIRAIEGLIETGGRAHSRR